MRWQGRRESDNVEDRRNSSGGGPSIGGAWFSFAQWQRRHHPADCGAGGGVLWRGSHRINDRPASFPNSNPHIPSIQMMMKQQNLPR
ncbi:Uncharacterised protein [Citrobacter freundii]|nr:Uncharacterised protein [Citrobacter freundii]